MVRAAAKGGRGGWGGGGGKGGEGVDTKPRPHSAPVAPAPPLPFPVATLCPVRALRTGTASPSVAWRAWPRAPDTAEASCRRRSMRSRRSPASR